jgi:superfamily II DNA/RNA helicase
LTYFLFTGNQAPHNILQLPSVKRAIHDENEPGITLIYVQRISDGAELHLSLLEYCDSNGMLEVNNVKPVAFLHSNLTDDKKIEILQNAVDLKIRILIATSAVGAGINLPVLQFIGWGLDGDTTGIVQSQGRTARNPMRCEGIVIWVHNSGLHGRRVPLHSKVRDLLNSECLREKMNHWFDHQAASFEISRPEPEFCCSLCMKRCIE